MNNNTVANSLEAFHGTMHDRIGGKGHMSNTVAAGVCLLQLSHQLLADPIFPSLRSNLHASPYQC
jgi:hypothetical protein